VAAFMGFNAYSAKSDNKKSSFEFDKGEQ